jgi:nicotinate-nucleotide pyrophosphorylase (carboxylating)
MASKEFTQHTWNAALADDCRQLIRLATREDLDRAYDWTTVALVPESARAKAVVAARQPGVIAGVAVAALVIEELQLDVEWTTHVDDGARVERGQAIATIEGSARDMLTGERILLNFLGQLSGVATLTRRFVDAITGTQAKIYDTRKTTPGWRRLEKYAVKCGGGMNHRTGLFDAVLIKDNHLAFARSCADAPAHTPAEAVAAARVFLKSMIPHAGDAEQMIVEVEVDSLDQFYDVLPQQPDIILLDNMPPALLRTAVERRNALAPAVQLEASGGVNLETIRAIAESGVDRISVGALTHSAICLDVGLDWA